MREIKGDYCHQLLREKITPALTYDEKKDFEAWRKELKEKLLELSGLNRIAKNACPLNVEIEKEVQKEGYKQIRFTFESEKGAVVPCYLLIPDTGKEKYPLAITLQGHSSGLHNSIAEPKPGETEVSEYAAGRGKFAVQAVQNGYAALAIEQRGMGERRPSAPHQNGAQMCEYTAHIALLLGRTVLGERMWDVSKAIDAVAATFDCVDIDKVLITGNSGGGTMSYYAACYDERIKLSVPSCAFCPYEDSIMHWYHCSCNFIPHAYEWFEMQDLSALIAPRNLVLVNGEKDAIFPVTGARKGYETVKSCFEKVGAADKCKMIETPKAHWWCEDLVWSAINEETKKMGW